ncbi:MAG: hypothetical protein WCB18_08260 [Thermoplasmata archaeon]
MPPPGHLIGRDRESALEGVGEVLEIRPMGAGHRDLEDVGHLVRVLAGEIFEEGADLSRGSLEQRHHFVGSFEGPLPHVGGLDGEPVDTRRQPALDGGVPEAARAGSVGERAVDDP